MVPADAQINQNDALGESLLSLNGDFSGVGYHRRN